MKLVYLVSLLLSGTVILSGCVSDSEAGQSNGLQDISFTIVSEGMQSDIQNQRLDVIRNDIELSSLISSVPTITGNVPSADFSSETLISIYSGFEPCTDLDVSYVKENSDTVLVGLVKVYTADPGLCDPTVEAFSNHAYTIVSIEKSDKPISYSFTQRNDF